MAMSAASCEVAVVGPSCVSSPHSPRVRHAAGGRCDHTTASSCPLRRLSTHRAARSCRQAVTGYLVSISTSSHPCRQGRSACRPFHLHRHTPHHVSPISHLNSSRFPSLPRPAFQSPGKGNFVHVTLWKTGAPSAAYGYKQPFSLFLCVNWRVSTGAVPHRTLVTHWLFTTAVWGPEFGSRLGSQHTSFCMWHLFPWPTVWGFLWTLQLLKLLCSFVSNLK